jgi:hypothetical protein
MIWVVVIVLVVGLAVGVISTLRITGWRPGQRAIEAEQVFADASVVTLTGTVRVIDEPLISPLSASRCVMFESYANLYEWPGGAKKDDDTEGPKAPKALAGQVVQRKMIPFELVTAAGTVLVDATEADLELAPTPVFPRFPEREARFLREHDKDERLIENATFEEITVDPDSLVSIHGRVVVESPTKVRLVADGESPLVIGVPRASVMS